MSPRFLRTATLKGKMRKEGGKLQSLAGHEALRKAEKTEAGEGKGKEWGAARPERRQAMASTGNTGVKGKKRQKSEAGKAAREPAGKGRSADGE